MRRACLHDVAYAVADRLRSLRIARGERPVGWKIGFTNRSLWPRYGVDRPMWAPVWDTTLRMLGGHEARLSLNGLSQPRIEPEIAFVFDVAPRAGMSLDELRGCLAWVAHAFEIVHTHYDGWRFTPADTAADFALHGRLFVGPRVPVPAWSETLAADLSALRVELLCNGEVKDSGVGSVVLDGPLQALKALIDSMAAITPQWHVAAGDVDHHRHDHRRLAVVAWAALDDAPVRRAPVAVVAARRSLKAAGLQCAPSR